jgi:tRNA nucleotidyltransferase/poly(A) polymerase
MGEKTMLETSIKILKKLEKSGYEAYIVGGFVRDYLLNKKTLDVDICTNATPKELNTIFKNAVIPSEAYGAVTIMLKDIRFEITTFRQELKYLNNRKR